MESDETTTRFSSFLGKAENKGAKTGVISEQWIEKDELITALLTRKLREEKK